MKSAPHSESRRLGLRMIHLARALPAALALTALAVPIKSLAQSNPSTGPTIDFAVPQRVAWAMGRIAFGHITHRTGPPDVMSSYDGGPGKTIMIYSNNGSGVLTLAQQFNPQLNGQPDLQQSVLIDVNNDGWDDIVALGKTGFDVYLNNNGTLGATPVFSTQATAFPTDFNPSKLNATRNANGVVDLLITGAGGGSRFKSLVFHGNGNGTFSPAQSVPNSTYIVTGAKYVDFDGSGYPAIVVTDYGGQNFCIVRNNGNGTYTETTVLAPNSNTDYWRSDAVAIDMNRDGILDLVVTTQNPKQVVWYRGLGNTTFDTTTKHVAYSGGIDYYHPGQALWTDNGAHFGTISAADIDGDGQVDLMASYQTSSPVILRNNGDGTFSQVWKSSRTAVINNLPPLNASWAVAHMMYFVDLAGNGQRSLVGANYFNNSTQYKTTWGLYYGPNLSSPSDTTAPVITAPADIVQEAVGPNGNAVTFTATATDDVDGPVPVVASPASGSTFPIATTIVGLAASDKAGNTADASFKVTIHDTTAPALTVPSNIIVEATGANGAAVGYPAPTATDVVGVTSLTSSPASGSTFALGSTTVSVSAKDAAGNTSTGSFTVTVRDTTAPVITSLTPSSASLWPANHKMVAVTIATPATDAVGVASLKIISVTSSEPDNGLGDGDTPNDIQITGDLTVNLRAERSGNGNGRTYTITVEAKDAAGNSSTKTTTVSVPKSQGGK